MFKNRMHLNKSLASKLLIFLTAENRDRHFENAANKQELQKWSRVAQVQAHSSFHTLE